MMILPPALPSAFGKLFAIIAALARKTISIVRQALRGTLWVFPRTDRWNDIAQPAFSCEGILGRNLHDETTRYLLRRRAHGGSGFRIGSRLARHHELKHRFHGSLNGNEWPAAFDPEPNAEGSGWQ